MKSLLAWLVIVLSGFIYNPNLYAQIPPPGGGSDTNGGGGISIPPDIANRAKYLGQFFTVIDTNTAASNDTNLYNALLAFGDNTNSNPTLEILPYQTTNLLVKASHFDYSGETVRHLALVVNDRVDVPVLKSIKLLNTDTNNGWLVQGSVQPQSVTDTMYFLVSNISRIYNGFFRVIPYSGPTVELTGYSDYDVISNTVSIHANVTDLSGITEVGYSFGVLGTDIRFQLDTNNDFEIDTRYTPNGLNDVRLSVFNDARLFDTNNIPDNSKLNFQGEHSLALDFENSTYMAWASDNAHPDIGTNFIYFYVDQARHITASIAKTNGQVVKSFSGDTEDATYIAIPFDFTEVDGVTPFSNDVYVVNFNATEISSSPIRPRSGGGGTDMNQTNRIDKGGNIRPPNGCLLTYQYDDPSLPSGSTVNDRADTAIGGNLLTLYKDIYKFFSLTQYDPSDVGTNRNATQCHPYDSVGTDWIQILKPLTNYFYSDLTIAQAHGTGGFLGGAKYLPSTIDSHDLELWVKSYPDQHRWRLRKASMFACYSADKHLATLNYPTWPEACGIRPMAIQVNSMNYKNCGMFFAEGLGNFYYDNELSGYKTTAEIAAAMDQTWICGENQYPGGCSPVYSWYFAAQSTINRFDEFTSTQPIIMGSPYCIYTSIWDDFLRNMNYLPVANKPSQSQVKILLGRQ